MTSLNPEPEVQRGVNPVSEAHSSRADSPSSVGNGFSSGAANETLVDLLLAEQRTLTAVERFSQWHDQHHAAAEPAYRRLLPLTAPARGQQYAFEVDLDKCSGCKACVTACHSLNGLEEDETWRSVGLLISPPATHSGSRLPPPASRIQHITTACHHCVDPACANGCPVLAYEKDEATGIVRHLDDQCMGCSYCVMKCPYEVPKYSSRLGIVRKCDMCYQRLSGGEAPACVQACPNEAIRIIVVERSAIDHRQSAIAASGLAGGQVGKWAGERSGRMRLPTFSPAHFLPDSPDPRITLPTTRFLTKLQANNLIAADHDAPRLDQPHWPLIFMLILTQAAAGMFLMSAIAQSCGLATTVKALVFAGFGLLAVGLTASVLHLGQPVKAWRAFLGWRKSWLSREIIAFNTFAGVALVAILYPQSSIFAAALGLVAVFVSAMVYVDTRRPLWSARFVFTNFFGTTLLLGATFAAVVCSFGDAPAFATQIAALAALVTRTALLGWRRLHWRAALNDPANPIHYNAGVVRALLPWTMPARTQLYLVSTTFGLLALVDFLNATPLWVSLAAVATLSSEVLVRYVFFTASASKRMPGGVAT